MYPEPNIQDGRVTDTLPPPSAEDTAQQFRLDLDPDDDQVMILEDDGYPD
jgi:hypothetical protein